MKSVAGTVRFLDLEGGLWVLDAEDGERYQIQGGERGLLVDGRRAIVEGEVTESFSIGMHGPLIEVRGWRPR